jgi:thiol-disulfide isomerase/thioredoxin
MSVSTLVGYTANFFLTYFALHKRQEYLTSKQILAAIFLGASILEIPFRIFNLGLLSLPDFGFHLFGIICGYLFFTIHSYAKWGILLMGFSLAFLMYYDGYDRWIHKLNNGTFTGVVSYSFPGDLFASDEKGKVISRKDISNKIVLLDFWHTACGVCFQKFPKLQKVYEKYKSNPTVTILAVNTPLEEDKEGQAFQMIQERGYTFPVVIAKRDDLAKALDVKGYPTTFIVDPQGTVIFKGSIEYASDRLEKLLAP